MRLLIDQNLPRRLASLLNVVGHDAVHTEDEGLATTADSLILSWCCGEARLLVTADKKADQVLCVIACGLSECADHARHPHSAS